LARAYGKAAGREIPLVFAPRRAGDVDACYADPGHALATMGWQATRDLEQMCVDSWRWQSLNPEGFGN
jgi:UDP-glucose 4-epimerase